MNSSTPVLQQFSLSGKTAFITGGTSGLGLAIARGFVQAGAKMVIVGSKTQDKVQAAVELLKNEKQHNSNEPTSIHGVGIDVGDTKSITAAFEDIDRLCCDTSLDILVDAAGVLARYKAEEEPLEVFERTMRINVTGSFLCSQKFAQRVLKHTRQSNNEATVGSGSGATATATSATTTTTTAAAVSASSSSSSSHHNYAILNIASLTSTIALSDVTSYACSKAAIAQLTRQLGNDWSRYNIRVNAIAPGVFPTAINREAIEGTPRGLWMITQTPMNRFGESSELAGLAVFLCSNAASFMTCAVVPCDGGFLGRGVGPTS
jgi:NAD(P)-dependent dehydrogenase (short-subunit alcohol dehydrogenase family)